MDHHGHSHSHTHFEQGSKTLKFAILLTVTFMAVEWVGGWFANSLALMTDAAHMLSDSAALVFSLLVLWVAKRPATLKSSYGYQRAEILGALLSGLVVWMIAGFLIFEAIQRVSEPQAVKGEVVSLIAVIGLIVNLVVAKLLYSSQKVSLNIKAAYLHVLGDLLGSVGALVSGIVIWFTGWTLIDPILTFFICSIVLYSSWSLIKEAVYVLMEFAPKEIDPNEVQVALEALPAVLEVHDLHIWMVSSKTVALSVHLVAKDHNSALSNAKELLKEQFKINHTTIQTENPDYYDVDDCHGSDCK